MIKNKNSLNKNSLIIQKGNFSLLSPTIPLLPPELKLLGSNSPVLFLFSNLLIYSPQT